MLTSELITENNLEEALAIQNEIFPRENAKANFLESIQDRKNSFLPAKFKKEYYLVLNEKGKAIGLWGHYLVGDEFAELWLGWYGVVPYERRQGYGMEIFKMFEKYAKNNRFSTIRLYTDEIDNSIACYLYEKMGMTKEYYKNEEDITEGIGKIVIYSKSLTEAKVKPWNSKFINYREQKMKECR